MQLDELAGNTTRQLKAIWDEIGLEMNERDAKLQKLFEEAKRVFQISLKEAEDYRAELQKNLAEETSRIISIKRSFGENLTQREIEESIEGLSLILKRETVGRQFTNLQKEKEARLAKLQAIALQVNTIWAELDEKLKSINPPLDLLTTQHLQNLESTLEQAAEEKETRLAEFNALQRNMEELVDELQEPDIIENLKKPLSRDSLRRLQEEDARLMALKDEREEEVKGLAVKITELWQTLHVSEEEQLTFYEQNTGLSSAIVQVCRDELVRLQRMKQERLAQLIEEKKAEVISLWEELGVTPEERTYQWPTVATERALDSLCEAVQVLQQRAGLLRPILSLIQRREELLKEKLEFEQVTSDPNRLLTKKTGGGPGRLLQEEKQRKVISQKITINEGKLRKAVGEWEAANGELFVWQGEPFMEKFEKEVDKSKDRLYTPSKRATPSSAKKGPATPLNSTMPLPSSTLSGQKRPVRSILSPRENLPTPDRKKRARTAHGVEKEN